MSVWESLLAALNPVAVGGSTALVDGLLLLLFALALVQELAHLSRAVSLRSAATLMRQRPALRGLAQVEPLVAPVVAAVPPLAGPMQALVASAVLWGERVRAERGAASLLQLDDLRATGGVVLLPDGLLRAMPSLLVTLGAFGVLLGLAPALGDQTQALSALTLSFRCAVWGLGCGVLLSAVNNLSVGMAEGALRSLVASLDQQLPPLGDAAAMRALTLAEEAQALARSESVRREESEAAALKVAVEHARIARIAEERLLRLHEGLTLQQQDQARRQEALLTAVESTRQAMLALGPAVEGALERGMNVQLGPALAELSRQQSLSAQSAREHLNNIAANQLASADRMSARLIEGIDQGLLAPLRQVNEALTAASETQAQGLLA